MMDDCQQEMDQEQPGWQFCCISFYFSCCFCFCPELYYCCYCCCVWFNYWCFFSTRCYFCFFGCLLSPSGALYASVPISTRQGLKEAAILWDFEHRLCTLCIVYIMPARKFTQDHFHSINHTFCSPLIQGLTKEKAFTVFITKYGNSSMIRVCWNVFLLCASDTGIFIGKTNLRLKLPIII